VYKLIASLVCLCCSFSLYAQNDPTRPLVGGAFINNQTAKSKGVKLVLQSVIKSNEMSPNKAIISGKLVEQGQQVFGYKVVRIEERKVLLQSEDKARELTLFSQSVVKYK